MFDFKRPVLRLSVQFKYGLRQTLGAYCIHSNRRPPNSSTVITKQSSFNTVRETGKLSFHPHSDNDSTLHATPNPAD